MSYITPHPQALTTVVATEQHLPIVASLARDIWNLYYPSIISQAQIDYMLGQRYTAQALKRSFDKKGASILLAQIGPMAIGYALLTVADDSPDETCIDAFYLHPNHHRRGFGTSFMNQVIDHLSDSPRRIIELNVNRLNISAINFYFRNGFVIRSVVDVNLGHGFVGNDYIMERRLD
jgi:ribosomal protein S18 acetylase RimI-like enzyme